MGQRTCEEEINGDGIPCGIDRHEELNYIHAVTHSWMRPKESQVEFLYVCELEIIMCWVKLVRIRLFLWSSRTESDPVNWPFAVLPLDETVSLQFCHVGKFAVRNRGLHRNTLCLPSSSGMSGYVTIQNCIVQVKDSIYK